MWEKQNQAENDRMVLQNQWNKEAAEQSQQYAKDMFDYTGYENQVKQMKAAGLNPALMNGGGGSAGQASAGAEVQPAQAFQPMGIQMALQAQQVMANTQLANAEADKTRAEATAQNMQNLIGNSIDLAQKIGEIGRTKQEKKNLEVTYNKTVNEVKKVQEEVNNLMPQGDAQIITIKLIPCVCDIRTRATYFLPLNSSFKNLPNSLAYSPSPVSLSSSLDAAWSCSSSKLSLSHCFCIKSNFIPASENSFAFPVAMASMSFIKRSSTPLSNNACCSSLSHCAISLPIGPKYFMSTA
jgi:hypothetical protein